MRPAESLGQTLSVELVLVESILGIAEVGHRPIERRQPDKAVLRAEMVGMRT